MDEEEIILEDYEENKIISDDEEYDNETIISSVNIPDSIEFYKNYKEYSKSKITDPCLTKYEKTKVLSERTQQIENGSIIYIPLNDKLQDSYSIALEEFKQKKIPFIICRPLPNSKDFEYWKLNDLKY
jgi:DNA-directed RNA polymerase subunit K/omega